MPTEAGYSNQKKLGTSQFKTIHQLGSGRYGAPSSPKGLAEILAATAIVSVTPVLGKDGQIEFYNIEITAHGIQLNDVLRMETGTLVGWEFDIIRVIDVDNFYILPVSETPPIAAETASVLRWVTQKLAIDGSISASISSAPTQFIRDGLDQQVVEDTAVLANNRAFPSEMYINRDGVQRPVVRDTAVPGNNVPVPTIVLDASGNPVNMGGASAPLAFANLDFGSSPVDSLAYVEVLATIGATQTSKAQIFMSSGDPLYLAFGAAAAEIDQLIIIPGGNGFIDLDIPAGTRLSVRAVDVVTVNSGRLIINLLG